MDALNECAIQVVYASQTGNAEELAYQVVASLRETPLRKRTETSISFSRAAVWWPGSYGSFPTEKVVVFVVATAGDGEFPDGCRRAWRSVLRRDLRGDTFAGVRYAVLGLGDSSYARYNAAARKLDRRLLDLGGQRLIESTLLDEQNAQDLDGAIAAFISALCSSLGVDNGEVRPPARRTSLFHVREVRPPDYRASEAETGARNASLWRRGAARAPDGFYHDALFTAADRLTDATRDEAASYKNAEEDVKDVRLVRLNLAQRTNSGASPQYRPGDVAYVLPRNSEDTVDAFFRLFSSLDAQVYIDLGRDDPPLNCTTPCSVRELAYAHFDLLARPSRRLLARLAPFAAQPHERERLEYFASTEGEAEFYQYAIREARTVLLTLRDFESVRPPLGELLSLLPRIRARAFSIASSASFHGAELQLCVALVRYTTPPPLQERRDGLCSSFLRRLSGNDIVPVRLSPGSLRFDLQRCGICVGPGTGVAPFRSLLLDFAVQRRMILPAEDPSTGLLSAASAQAVRSGDAVNGYGWENPPFWLFFGCRHERRDFLFADEWRALERAGVVKVVTAFSRDGDGDRRVYVQQKMAERSAALGAMLEQQSASVYVAGSSGAMPRGVRTALCTVLSDFGGEEAGEEKLKLLIAQRRYQEECWS